MDASSVLHAVAADPLAAGAVVGSTLSAALATYGIAVAPARQGEKLGPRGLKRQRAIEEGELFPVLEPLLRWAGARLSGLLPDRLRRAIDRRLVMAGDYLGLDAEEYVVLLATGLVLGALLATFYGARYGAASTVVGAVMGAFYAQSHVDTQIRKRANDITHGLPYVTDLIALAMSSGLDFPGAVRNVVERSSDKKDALTEELELILHELAIGHTRRYALEQLAARTRVPVAVEFAFAVIQAEERGGALTEVIAVQAAVSRQKRTALAEEMMGKAQQKMSLPLMLLMASVMILLMTPMMLKVADAFERYL